MTHRIGVRVTERETTNCGSDLGACCSSIGAMEVMLAAATTLHHLSRTRQHNNNEDMLPYFFQ
jgi:dihydroorotase